MTVLWCGHPLDRPRARPADDPVWFVMLSALVFFARGEIDSLFPATCTDIDPCKDANTSCRMLFTAKGAASLLAPLASALTSATRSWNAVSHVAPILDVVAAVMVLRPMRQRTISED